MSEEAFNNQPDSNFLSDCISSDELYDDNNFLSSEVKPENIFKDQGKDAPETQLSSKILGFPFTLDSYHLLFLKSKDDPEIGGPEVKIILGDFENVKYCEPFLKLIFFSKDRKTPLNLVDYPNELKSLTVNLGIEFICIHKNKMFIQCESENLTNEAYTSLQTSSTLFELLYDEEKSINSLEDQAKGINSLFSSDKKTKNDISSNEDILSSNKKDKMKINFNKFDEIKIFDKKTKEKEMNSNIKEPKSFFMNNQKNNYKNTFNNQSPNFPKNSEIKLDQNNSSQSTVEATNKNNSAQKQKSPQVQKPPILFSPQLFPPFLYTFNNLPKVPPQPQINPSLMMQAPKFNPFLLQTAMIMQNIIKMQQLSLKQNDTNNNNKEKNSIPLNNINFNGKIDNNTKSNTINESDKYNKESSTNSSSSNESSSSSNSKTNNNLNNNNLLNSIPNFNYGIFNRINLNNTNTFQNNTLKNNLNNNTSNDLKTSKANNLENDASQSDENEKNNYHLEQIVLNNQYKEYIPKRKEKEKEKQKEVEFHTNSTRDYQYKYVSRYIVQIENEKNFPVTKMIIGNNGKLLRQILLDNCINCGDNSTKIRLRGRGSGYKEGPKNEESKDPMELCISSLNMLSYIRCSQAIENLLLQVYYQYYVYQCNTLATDKKDEVNIDNMNGKKELKDKNGCPILMKKILKYQYVVNRYNTLVKEEKKRKKEEELKQVNQNLHYNDINGFNHV